MDPIFKYLNEDDFRDDPIVFALPQSFVRDFIEKLYNVTLEEDELATIQHNMLCPGIAGIATLNALSRAASCIIDVDCQQLDEVFDEADKDLLGRGIRLSKN